MRDTYFYGMWEQPSRRNLAAGHVTRSYAPSLPFPSLPRLVNATGKRKGEEGLTNGYLIFAINLQNPYNRWFWSSEDRSVNRHQAMGTTVRQFVG